MRDAENKRVNDPRQPLYYVAHFTLHKSLANPTTQGPNMLRLISVFICILPAVAFAQHPPQHQALHLKFYQHWMMPDNRSISCCHDEDCGPAESKLVNGHWMARKIGATDFTPIPEQKIERDRDSPDGRSHLCLRGGTVFCFAPGFGG